MKAFSDIADRGRCGARSPAAVARSATLLPFLLLLGTTVAHAAALPTLHTARQVHSLRSSEADRQYPVHLARAQITFCQTDLSLVFLRDSTGGIFADIGTLPSFRPHPGDFVSVDGVSSPGKFTPVIINARFRLLGHASLPAPPLTSFDRVLSGAVDSQWVGVRGIVRSVRPIWDIDVSITIASGQDRIEVITPGPITAIPSGLVDAGVYVQASAGASFNHRNQLIGTFLFMPDVSFLRIEEPARDPFTRSARRVEDVMRPGTRGPGHRVHLRGIVTSTWGGQHFSLMGPEHGIFITTQDPVSVNVGDVLDVAGFPSVGDYTAVLEDSIVRRSGFTPPPAPIYLTPQQALTGIHDAESIEVDGQFLEASREDNGIPNLLLSAGGVSFLAVLPPGSPREALHRFQPGSRLRIRGICVIHAADDKTPQELTILLRSPADIVVLQRPSWWTTRNTLLVASMLWALAVVIAAWNFVLRRQVRRHTDTIRQQLREADALRLQAEAAHQEKSESLASVLSLQRDLLQAQENLHYQATHDALTGLWNRRALLDLLGKELERCVRTHSSMGVLMLDVDHFKPVNDTLGHLAGDRVLKEIAFRITGATRGYDLSGRYGGEEFLVLLPGCNHSQTEGGAERIRAAIASTPFLVSGSEIALTVSIGATVAPDCAQSETEILSLADLALYQAKSAGRNCTVLRTSFQEENAETI
jgi:diguanylate cyclase (GGDEF)-like protein